MTQSLPPPGSAAHPAPDAAGTTSPPADQGAGHPYPYPYPAYVSPGGPPAGTFALALAGAILGTVALLLTFVTMVVPSIFAGGGWEEDLGDEPAFEEISPSGTLSSPDSDGYTADEVTTAVSDALESYVYPLDTTCPAISAAMAEDLVGRAIVCEGDDTGWPMTVIVVFTDADGGFIATPY